MGLIKESPKAIALCGKVERTTETQHREWIGKIPQKR